jgi:phenylacetate-CoA ligase
MMQADQLDKLNRLLVALADNAFYASRLRDAGLLDGVDSIDSFIARCPFTTKQQIIDDQRATPPYGTNLTYPLTKYTRYNQTSGTTSTPLRWLDTNDDWQWMLGNWRRVFDAAGVRADDRVMFAFSFGPFLGFWTAFEAATQIGCLCMPGGGMSSEARLRMMLDNHATILCCTPTYAMRLAQVARDARINLDRMNVRRIIVAGEPGGSLPTVRAAIEKAWTGASVFDHHGMTEIGPVSYECPIRRGVLRVIESSYLAEVIDGELILTTLGRIGSPLLRYRTGDLVQPVRDGEADLGLEGGILGRIDDMVLVRGVNLYPSAIDEVMRGFVNVAEYRVDVTERDAMAEVSIVIEPADETIDAAALCGQVESAMRSAFNLRVPVSAAACGTLPRFEMKARRWNRS